MPTTHILLDSTKKQLYLKKVLCSFFFLFAISFLYGQVNHNNWDNLLQKHVNNGLVNYNGFAKDSVLLKSYLQLLANNKPNSTASKSTIISFYANLYNAATVALIIENSQIKSIKKIKNPWGKKRILLGNDTVSLNFIEHKILRNLDEPRIHFAINCASISCPNLLNKAFTAANLENLLEAATISFIQDKTKNNITESKAEISPIFKWFKKDFTKSGNVKSFISKYSRIALSKNTKISYLKYNWLLNKQTVD